MSEYIIVIYMSEKPMYRKRSCAVCLKNDRLLMVNILDKALGKHFWMPPGGGIEDGEQAYMAAEREAAEETGVVVKAYPETEIVKRYEFRFKDQLYVTKTHFFLAEFFAENESFDVKKREEEIFASEWVPLKLVFDRLRPWEEVQTAVYDLIYPLLRGCAGTTELDLGVSFEELLEES